MPRSIFIAMRPTANGEHRARARQAIAFCAVPGGISLWRMGRIGSSVGPGQSGATQTMLGWFKDRYAVYHEAAGVRRYLLGGIVAAAVGLIDSFEAGLQWAWPYFSDAPAPEWEPDMILGFPSWIVGITVLFALLWWFALSYAVRLRRQIRGANYELAKLRHSGVRLRNEGRAGRFGENAGVSEWESKVLQWFNDVVEAIRKVDDAEAERFVVLDTVPPPRLELILRLKDQETNKAFRKLYQEHDFRLVNLEKLMDRLGNRHGAR